MHTRKYKISIPHLPMGIESAQPKEQKSEIPAQEQPENQDAKQAKLNESRAKNDKLEKAVTEAKGQEKSEGKEKLDIDPRLHDAFLQVYNTTLQGDLGFNSYTDFTNYDAEKLRHVYDAIERSEAHVNSIPIHKISEGRFIGTKEALRQYASLPKDSTQKAEQEPWPDGEGEVHLSERQTAIVLKIINEPLQVSKENVSKAMKDKGIDPEKDAQERMDKGEKLGVIKPTPTNANLSEAARNEISKFRNSFYLATAPDGTRFHDMAHAEKLSDAQKKFIPEFNKAVTKWNNAIDHCVDQNISTEEKNKRAEQLVPYAKEIVVNNPAIATVLQKPEFKEWLVKQKQPKEATDKKE